MREIYALFDTLPTSGVPLNRPSGGQTYLFSWTDDSKADDWRCDGYRWRQSGSFKNPKNAPGEMKRVYFQVWCLMMMMIVLNY